MCYIPQSICGRFLQISLLRTLDLWRGGELEHNYYRVCESSLFLIENLNIINNFIVVKFSEENIIL